MEFIDYKDIIKQMERDMLQISDEVFRGFFDSPIITGRFWHPSMDLYENDTHVILKVEIAGVRVEDVQVSLSPDDRSITISGSRRESETSKHNRLSAHQLEIYCGPFGRTIALPHTQAIDRDAVTANYKDGILTVSIPKVINTVKKPTRMIPIEIDGAPSTAGDEQVDQEFASSAAGSNEGQQS